MLCRDSSWQALLSQHHEKRVLVGIATLADSRSTDFNHHPAFMAMELILGDLNGVRGKYIESPLYNVNIEKAIEYDTHFTS